MAEKSDSASFNKFCLEFSEDVRQLTDLYMMCIYSLYKINWQSPGVKNVFHNMHNLNAISSMIEESKLSQKMTLFYAKYKELISNIMVQLAKAKMEIIEKELIEKAWHPSRLAWVGELDDE